MLLDEFYHVGSRRRLIRHAQFGIVLNFSKLFWILHSSIYNGQGSMLKSTFCVRERPGYVMKGIKRRNLTNFRFLPWFALLLITFSTVLTARAQTGTPSPSPAVSSIQITRCWEYSTANKADESITSNGSRVF